jgi:fructose-1,6-bisphosphatase/inositol monophosphatase family enzyme
VLKDIEIAALADHRGRRQIAWEEGGSHSSAVYFGLRLLLEAGRLVRNRRNRVHAMDVEMKVDGSPATRLEAEIEDLLRELLGLASFHATVFGEETGGEVEGAGLTIAIDPIDGTWAFLSDTETYGTTLAFIRESEVELGLVSNPVSGELAYAVRGSGARLLRLSVFGEPDEGFDLPSNESASPALLVNLHPSRDAASLIQNLYGAWERREVAMVRSPGGSPAWALVEAARGNFVYVNRWSGRAAVAYDLAAAGLILEEAGGALVDDQGQPIDLLGHQGLFVAGLDRERVSGVTKILHTGGTNP